MVEFNLVKEFIKKFIPSWLLDLYHFILAFLGALIYGFPSKKIKVIGITGTNGKTTTTEMIAKIFQEAGEKICLLNSIRVKIDKEEKINDLRMTMPGRFFIQRFLKKAVDLGCKFAILEVTSEGIKQHRHRFINFNVAVFMNLAPEHIESHGSFEKYKMTKGKFFEATKEIHVINIDDENAEFFLKIPASKKFCFGKKGNVKTSTLLNNQIQLVLAKEVKTDYKRIHFRLNGINFTLKALGEFNLYNALAAICVAKSQGISFKTCKRALEKFEGVPGRMELVIEKPFKVFIDYAFTPYALEKVYQELTSQFKKENSRLICVLGAAGGGRDKWKRPVLGSLAAKYCDEVIVTNEDPYDEDPWEIIEQVALGTEGKAKKILDRREAIQEALKLAKEDDIVIITGKGCEPSICVARGRKIPWDERKVVMEEFQKIYGKI